MCRFGLDPAWAETGDRYLLKLFRDYLFHQVTGNGAPWLDLSHIIQTLNKVWTIVYTICKAYASYSCMHIITEFLLLQLDVRSPERICLVSRDEQSVMVVSFEHLNNCLSAAFSELQQACNSDAPFVPELSS